MGKGGGKRRGEKGKGRKRIAVEERETGKSGQKSGGKSSGRKTKR